MEELTAFLARLPKIELHVHLESTMPGEMLERFAAAQGRSLPRPAAEHPLRRLLDAGVVVTLNRDDPTFLGGLTLTEELRRAAEFAGMSREALAACQIAAARAAFCTPRERDALVNTLEEFRRTLD